MFSAFPSKPTSYSRWKYVAISELWYLKEVQDGAGAAGEWPQGTDASATEGGPELRGGE